MSFTNNNEPGLLRVGGLWKNRTKAGKAYLGGTIGGIKVMIFANEFKQSDSDPEYVLNIAAAKPKKQAQQTRQNDSFDL